MRYSYSFDEEVYFGDFDELEKAANSGFKERPEVDKLWVGERHDPEPHDFILPESILESLLCNAYDECGDLCGDWLSGILKDSEKLKELKTLIGDWVQANDPPKFWVVTHPVLFKK